MMAAKTITIRKKRHDAHSPEDVWVALTDPHARAEWMEPNDHQPSVGHKFKFVTDRSICGRETECEVLEAVREDEGTTLILEQSGAEECQLGDAKHDARLAHVNTQRESRRPDARRGGG